MNFDTIDYLFDLCGYAILRNAVEPELITALNKTLDDFPELPFLGWHGNVQRLDNNGSAGVELQNIVEAGEPFEKLIDHPSWINRLERYCGEKDTYVEGLFIDECFASIRRSGGSFPIHSGGHHAIVRNQYQFVNGHFRCGQVNIPDGILEVHLNKGDALLFVDAIMHGASARTNPGERRVVI